jgi:tetratricopeptide (TPR) repeat protein
MTGQVTRRQSGQGTPQTSPQGNPALRSGARTGSRVAYSDPFGEAGRRRADPEAEEVRELYRRLLTHPAASRPGRVRGGEFDHPGLCRHLAESSADRIFEDPAEALGLARLGLGVAERLGDTELLFQTRLELANALRVRGEIQEAEREVRQAGHELETLESPPFLEGRYHHLLTSLAGDQQRFGDALRHADRAIALFRRAGVGVWECEALVKKGHTLAQTLRPSDALRTLRRALPLLDPERHLRLFVICLHNIVAGLNELGYSIAARSLLADLKGLHERLGDEVNLLRFRWLEGTIRRDLGQLPEAEEAFREVQAGFLDLDLPYNAAIVSLHLAEVYLQQSRSYKLRDLATRMFPVFQSRRIHREALAALIIFREAVSLHTADLELIRGVATFLDRARTNLKLRFRPPV